MRVRWVAVVALAIVGARASATEGRFARDGESPFDAQPSPAPALTITPAQHDYGRTALRASALSQFTVGFLPGETLQVSIVGPNAADFVLQSDTGGPQQATFVPDCVSADFRPVSPCPIKVDFLPRAVGVKTATLVVTNARGGKVTAALRGEGVSGTYSGSFAWQSDLNGPYGQNKKAITVTVVNGVATCDGTETDVTISKTDRIIVQTEVGSIQGRGLIAVTFEAEGGKPAYRVAVACPSPQWPVSVNRPGEPARPSQPAEWGSSYAEESYLQPMPGPTQGGVLDGSRSTAHPDTDSANGVTGSMIVSWRLKPS